MDRLERSKSLLQILKAIQQHAVEPLENEIKCLQTDLDERVRRLKRENEIKLQDFLRTSLSAHFRSQISTLCNKISKAGMHHSEERTSSFKKKMLRWANFFTEVTVKAPKDHWKYGGVNWKCWGCVMDTEDKNAATWNCPQMNWERAEGGGDNKSSGSKQSGKKKKNATSSKCTVTSLCAFHDLPMWAQVRTKQQKLSTTRHCCC